jgi:uncharacterized protein (TIGR00304 family)
LSIIAAIDGGFELIFTWVLISAFQIKSALAVVGVLMMLLGSIVVVLSPFIDAPVKGGRKKDVESMPEKDLRTAGVLLIGPLPIIWSSDRLWSIAAIIVITMLAMMIISLFL